MQCMLYMVRKKPRTSCTSTKFKVPVPHQCLADLVVMRDAITCSIARCSMTAWQVICIRQTLLALALVPRLLLMGQSSTPLQPLQG